MFEYTEDEATHRFQKLPDIPEWFERELAEIGGLNPRGKPHLRVVKGNEVFSDRHEGTWLKYHLGYSPTIVKGIEYRLDGETKTAERIEDVPEGAFVTNTRMEREPLGKLRYIIEKWTSPSELAEQGRFSRTSLGGTKYLRDLPREGIYELYYVVESADGKFRALDNLVLEFIRFKWKYDQQPEEVRERAYFEWEASMRRREYEESQEKIKAALDGDYRLPREEMERRREFWAKHDYSVDPY